MEQTKTHWKKLTNPDYIGAYSLMQGDTAPDLTVTIVSVARQMVTGADGKKEECTVAQLANQKPFILNSTNQKMITKLYGTPYIEDWAGKRITLYVTKVKVGADWTECLRIRPTVPQNAPQLPELTPTHEKWEGAKKALKEGATTIEAIRKVYILSVENEKALTA